MKSQEQINKELMDSKFSVEPGQDVNLEISKLPEFIYEDEIIQFASVAVASSGKGEWGLLILTSKRVMFVNFIKSTGGFEILSYIINQINSVCVKTTLSSTDIVISNSNSIQYSMANKNVAMKMYQTICQSLFKQ